MTNTDMNFTEATANDSAALSPFRPTGSRYYDTGVAAAFFERSGQEEKIAAGTVLFVENEKSSKQGILTQPISTALFKKSLSDGLFSKANAHRMYFLADGEVELTAGGKPIDTIKAGGVFGEMAVISELPGMEAPAVRSATATTKSACTAWSMDVAQVEKGLTKTPEFALMLMSVMFERLRFLASRMASRAGEGEHVTKKAEPVFDAATVDMLQDKLERAAIVRFSEGAKASPAPACISSSRAASRSASTSRSSRSSTLAGCLAKWRWWTSRRAWPPPWRAPIAHCCRSIAAR